jgi:hypothetical protein
MSALIGTLALSTAVQAGSEVSMPEKHATLSHINHKHTQSMLALAAPKDWKNKRFSYVHPKGADWNKSEGARQLRQRERNPTYKPSNNDKGYFMLTLFNDKNADGTMDDMCTVGNEIAMMGLEVGSCYAALEYHDDTVLGSFKVGVVEASSGRNHVHVESYAAYDCTGPARRTSNHMSRIHFDDEGSKVAPVLDPRSRHYWMMGEDDDDSTTAGDDQPMVNMVTCVEYSHHVGAAAPYTTSCINDGLFSGFSVMENCPNDEFILFTAIGNEWGQCFGTDGLHVQATCANGAPTYSAHGAYDPNTNSFIDNDQTCSNTPFYTETGSACRAYSPGRAADHASQDDDDDDFEGGPDSAGDPGWNQVGHQNYDPFFNTLFNASPEGGYIQGSSLYVSSRCWTGLQSACPAATP